jgi:two-component system, chemotaxis family, CheB/CheR fusion protein
LPSKQRPGRRGKRTIPTRQGPEATPTFPIVGVGASAGGLEAFAELIRHIPPDSGLAFVLVQHYDPTHKSVAPEILARATRLDVSEARDGTSVQPNNVYVIPPNHELRIHRGKLVLSPRHASRGVSTTIDRFLVSLAKDLGTRAVSVVLSGMSADGSKGTVAIREVGGRTFAQDDLTAKYNAMPYSAIQTGAVEVVRSPQGIAEALLRIAQDFDARSKAVAVPSSRRASPELLEVLTSLRSTTGVDFTRYKPATLERRVARRMVQTRVRTMREYASLLARNKQEAQALYDDLLIHVTSFFRNGHTFDFLEKQVFPALLKKRAPRETVRIWVPACSTGEEAYSIAILLREYLDRRRQNVTLQIFGTDVSPGAIQKARAGTYPEAIAKDVGPARLGRFFVKTERGYQVTKAIRQSIIFATHDVTQDPPFSKMDLISCRNLMIYLGPELQSRIIPTFHYALKPKGFLVLGPAETIGPFSNLFAVVDRKKKIYAKKATAARLDLIAHPSSVDPQAMRTIAPEVIVNVDTRIEADRLVLARFAPAGVIVNERFDVLHFRGKTSTFLEHPAGEARLNLLKMAKTGLLPALRSTLEKAKKTNAGVRSGRTKMGSNGRDQEVILEVVPLKASKDERQFLVLFEAAEPVARKKPTTSATSRTKGSAVEHARIRALEEELAETKQYLQAVVESQDAVHEELQSAHEEVLSNNEELQSTNEELETAQEELQSANEELTTLNEELQNRNASLAQLYSDVNNLVNNINIPIVIVGNDLRIRRFTPSAEKLLNLIPADVGRPIGNIRPNLVVDDLEQLVREAVSTLGTQETEVEDRNGRRYALRVRPYRTEDDKIDGAVIALVDVEALRSSLDHVTESRDFAQAIVEAVQHPLLVLDNEFRIIHGNQAFHAQFPISPAEAKAKPFFDVNGGEWDAPALRERLTRLAASEESFERVPVEFPSARAPARASQRRRVRVLELSGRRIESGAWAAHMLLAVEDVTAAKASEEKLRKLNEDLESFSYSVTHDLRTPLQSIRGFAQTLLDLKSGQLDPDGRHYASNIVEASSRMSRIIEDLLQLSWASRGDLRKETVDVTSLAKTIVGRLALQERSSSVEVIIQPALTAHADPHLLEIVLENLLGNAWKFTGTKKDPKIEVGSTMHERARVFFVKDNGVGFDMGHASRLFQAFQRLHAPGQFPGTGIGLATVKRIVQRHGGRVWAESTAGKGATLFFTLGD